MRCVNCGDFGHEATSCTKSKNLICFNCRAEPKAKECYNCHKLGHVARDCPKTANAGRSSEITCYQCRKLESFARDCSKSPFNKVKELSSFLTRLGAIKGSLWAKYM
ncbi:hypothetical protein MSAN_01618500 [Mycena sanguinolenta]|uniref:CCHC-type domain-containing protein n=1 Tax=Mycena sanguinolenta TaxID=230812 RepID=A0A8H6Y2K0_9AGAR|nr:hypothetical protein MSAN_01618500 [Mycena sanguinolenta]